MRILKFHLIKCKNKFHTLLTNCAINVVVNKKTTYNVLSQAQLVPSVKKGQWTNVCYKNKQAMASINQVSDGHYKENGSDTAV